MAASGLIGKWRRQRIASDATVVDDRLNVERPWPHAPDATEEEVGNAGPKVGFDGKPLPLSPFGDAGGFGGYGI
jgi:hypothetical protein